MVTSLAVMTMRRCSTVRMTQSRRLKMVGTTTFAPAAESSLRKSRGWMLNLRHRTSLGTCAAMLDTAPCASSVVHRTSSPPPCAPDAPAPRDERSVRSSALAVSRLRSRARRSSSRST